MAAGAGVAGGVGAAPGAEGDSPPQADSRRTDRTTADFDQDTALVIRLSTRGAGRLFPVEPAGGYCRPSPAFTSKGTTMTFIPCHWSISSVTVLAAVVRRYEAMAVSFMRPEPMLLDSTGWP